MTRKGDTVLVAALKRYGKKIVTTKGIKGFKFKDSVNEKLKNSNSMSEIGY